MVFGSGPSTSTPIVQLAKVPNEVQALISEGMFYGILGVLTSVVTHYPDLDFVAIYKGYADGWSAYEIHALGKVWCRTHRWSLSKSPRSG